MHRHQYLLKAVGQRRGKILSNGKKMAWKPLGFRQDGDVRSFPLLEPRIVVVTEGCGRHFFCEHPVHQIFLGIGKQITDIRRGSVEVIAVFVGEFESLATRKDFGRKWPEVDSGSSKARTLPLRSSKRFISP